MRATAFASSDEPWTEELPSSDLRWPGANAEQVDFMHRVYDAHVARAAASRAFIGDLPAGELAEVEDGKKMRSAAAADCRSMLAAAREALAAQQREGSAEARAVHWIGITSGYRSAQRQFGIWQTNFRRYYDETSSQRAGASGGPHGDAAVGVMMRYVGDRVAAPGFSLHNDGRAADLKTSERELTLGANTKQRTPWRRTWFWTWLVDHAARFHFFQNTHIDEPWHWEHHPARQPAEIFEDAPIPAGEKIIDSVPLLSSHKGSPPDLYLRWNDLTRTDEIDVAMHFHGYSDKLDKMNLVTDKLPVSGLDWRDPDNAATVSGRTRPTLFILPRGNHDKTRGGGTGYTFPALSPDQALRELWSFALDQLTSHLGLPERPRVARLILTAHSGGGAALETVLKNYNPNEIHVFDALYHPVPNLVKWAKQHIDADADPSSTSQPGALRVFYLPGTKTESFTLTVKQVLRKALHGRPNARDLARRYRVETSSVGHPTVARQYGWRLFADNAAEVK